MGSIDSFSLHLTVTPTTHPVERFLRPCRRSHLLRTLILVDLLIIWAEREEQKTPMDSVDCSDVVRIVYFARRRLEGLAPKRPSGRIPFHPGLGGRGRRIIFGISAS